MQLFPENVVDNKVAICSDDGKIAQYGDLKADGKAMKKNTRPRSLFFILCDNTIETIRFYSAVMYANSVPLLLDSKIIREFLMDYYKRYQPAYIWAPASRLDELNNLGRICYRDCEHILIDTNIVSNLYEELALLLTTSGSTGNPKIVRISHKNLQENMIAMQEELKIETFAKGATTLPMNYTYGMSICNMHLYVGATILATNRSVFDKKFVEFIKKEKATNMQGVPFVHEMLERIGYYDNLPDHVTLITMGGGKAKEALQEKMNTVLKAKGVRFCALYGQTEGTTMLTKIPDGQHMNDINCIGVACKGMTAYIDHKTNELIFEGSSVCLGYAESDEDLMRGDDNKGILRTGDIAQIDDKGRIYLTGRVKRFVKMAGIRVNMDDVEKAVSDFLNGGECACCGEDNEMHIYIVGDHNANQIKKMLFDRMKLSNVMISIRRISQIQRNANGKIDYKEIEKTYEDCNDNS